MDRRAVPHRAADPGRRRGPAGRRRCAAAVGIARQRRTSPAGYSSWRCSLAAVFGFWQFARWALRPRHRSPARLNKVTFLASPALGWPDLRAGRVRVLRCSYPRGQSAFPKVVKLLYGQHPRSVGEELTAEIAAVLHEVTGHTYAFDHDPLARALIATETVMVEEDVVIDAESVLAPLVVSWFDAAAHIASVTVDKPAVIDRRRRPRRRGDKESAARRRRRAGGAVGGRPATTPSPRGSGSSPSASSTTSRSVPPTGAASSKAWSPTPSAGPGRPSGAWPRGGCGSCAAPACRPWSIRRWTSPPSPARTCARSTRTR